MDDLSDDISRAIEADFNGLRRTAPGAPEIARRAQPRPVTPSNPIAQQAAVHRDAIARHDRSILEIERERDITLRDLQARQDEAERAYREETARLASLMQEKREESTKRIETRRLLRKSSVAALDALQVNAATREAPMEERRVPRPVGVTDPPKPIDI